MQFMSAITPSVATEPVECGSSDFIYLKRPIDGAVGSRVTFLHVPIFIWVAFEICWSDATE